MKEIAIVVKKELIEIFRDKTTLIFLLIPFIVFPVFNLGMDYLNSKSDTAVNISIVCDTKESEKLIAQFIERNPYLNLNVKSIDSSDTLSSLKSGKIDCLIKIKNKSLDIIYNSGSFMSLSAAAKIEENFRHFYNLILSENHNDIFLINLKSENGNESNLTNSVYDIFAPILLILFVFQCSSSFSNDLFAGEKERKTIEMLMLSGVKKKSIYCGKALALVMLSVINLFFNLCSFLVSCVFFKSDTNQLKFIKCDNPIFNTACIILLLLALTLISAFISATVSVFSNNMKNSQMLNEVLLAVPIGIIALLTLGIIKDDITISKFIPLLNLLSDYNNAFSGNSDIQSIFISLATNLIFIIALIWLSVRYMKSEKFIS